MRSPAAYHLHDIQAHLMPNQRDQLVGTYSCRIDGRGRITFPQTVREVLASADFMDLGIYARGDHLEAVPICGGPSRTDWLVAVIGDNCIATVTVRRLSPAGVITIPKALREGAQLSGSVMLIGVGSNIQIWEPAQYKASRHPDDTRERRSPVTGTATHDVIPCARSVALI